MKIDRKQEYTYNDAVAGEQRASSSPTGRAHSGGENIFSGYLHTRDGARLRAVPTTGTEDADWSVWGAARDGARVTLTGAQIFCLALLVGLVVALAWANLHVLLIMLIALMTCVYLLTGLHKAWLITRGDRAISNAAGHARVATDDDLPRYTVLVALHREGRILPVLVKRLAAIDYPPARLEILLLIESDDMETQGALKTCALPSHIRPVIVPPGQPRTKPRALNFGLASATGEYIVIYDAEDRPEPDQLRKAVAAFRALPTDVICVQARLNFYNWRQSILAILFAVDYTVWYDLMLPGLTQAAAFVPLGGTSNHFRIEALYRLGGWDPFNVTEDCDLGARIARGRVHISMLDSTTWEEAVPRIPPWIKQRSRWVKGYLQTYLVHMRHPLRLWREMGPGGFADFQLLVGAQSLVLLLNPLVWLLTTTYALSKGTALGGFIQSLFPASLYYLALLSFVFGNFAFFYINLYGCVRRGYDHFARYALLSPLYWVLMSLGAWKGFISLIRHPHYWAKTEHGVSLPRLVDEQHEESPL
jgi:glycosyltransferase XagB